MDDNREGGKRVVPATSFPWKQLPKPNFFSIGDAQSCELERDRDVASAEPGWECSTCTYVNHLCRCACEVCSCPRETSALAPKQQQQEEEDDDDDEDEEEDEEQKDQKEEQKEQKVQKEGGREEAATLLTDDDSDVECAICIHTIAAADMASSECGHVFCTTCILRWFDTGHHRCPMCKASVTHLRVRRQLDGTRIDTPVSEPVVLLLRARWRERPTVLPLDNVMPDTLLSEPDRDEWTNEFEEDEEILLRARASSRVAAEHRALVRAANGGLGSTSVARKKGASTNSSGVRSSSRPVAAACAPVSPFAGMVGCKYRCVAPKAYATEDIAPLPTAGLEVSVVTNNTVITCLEARMVAGRGRTGQTLRLRCEAGWVSYVAANGMQLFELASAADGSTFDRLANNACNLSRYSDTRGSKMGKKAKKKERREAKAVAKMARRQHNKLAQAAANTQTLSTSARGSKCSVAGHDGSNTGNRQDS